MTPTGESPDRTVRRFGGVVGLLACIFGPLIGSIFVGPVALTVPFVLAFGWIFFLWRALPLVSVNWVAISAGVLSVVLAAAMFQYMGVWFSSSRRGGSSAWRWQNAVLMTGGVVALFVAGFAALGLTQAMHWFWALDSGPYVETASHWPFAVQRVSVPSRRTMISNNMKQMTLGLHTHADANKSRLLGPTFDNRGRALHSWETAMLPYIEQQDLYREMRLDLPWNHPHNLPWLETDIQIYQSPAITDTKAVRLSVDHFAGNVHVLGGGAISFKHFKDGTSNTVIFGEAAGDFSPWGKPGNVRDPGIGINRGTYTFGNPNPRIDYVVFALADGSVRVVNENLDPRVLKALATPAGGEVVRDDEW
jgi:hypothetical protein